MLTTAIETAIPDVDICITTLHKKITPTHYLLLQNLQALHDYPREEVEQKSNNVGLFHNTP